MGERVLHEWVDDKDRTWRVKNIPHGDTIIPWAYRYGPDGSCESSDGGACVDELARLVARVAELEASEKKLRACVAAADAFFLVEDAMSNATEEGVGKDLWLESQEHRNAYDAARAEVDK